MWLSSRLPAGVPPGGAAGPRPPSGRLGRRPRAEPRRRPGQRGCHDNRMPDNTPPADTRLGRLWKASESRGIPLRTILVTAAVLVAVFLAGKLVYRLRDVILLVLVAGFVAVILNPLVVALQRWRIRRRGLAVAVVTLWAVLVFAGLAPAFGYPLTNGITHLSNNLPSYVTEAEHGKGWIGHLVRRYHVQTW